MAERSSSAVRAGRLPGQRCRHHQSRHLMAAGPSRLALSSGSGPLDVDAENGRLPPDLGGLDIWFR